MCGEAANKVKITLTVWLLQEKSQVELERSDMPSTLYVALPSLWVTLQFRPSAAATVSQQTAGKQRKER